MLSCTISNADSSLRTWYTDLLKARFSTLFKKSESSCSVAQSNLEAAAGPEDIAQQAQTLLEIELAIQELPTRQREAFLMRYWEELDVAETATAMSCSEGSVKTHCSRAVHALSNILKRKGITL